MSAKKQSSLLSFFNKGSSTPTAKRVASETKSKNEEVDCRPQKRVILEEIDDSPVKSTKKKRRIVVSSDEEENTVEDPPRSATKKMSGMSTPKRVHETKACTPKTSRRVLDPSTPRTPIQMELADSFISSFRVEEDTMNDTVTSVATLDDTVSKVQKPKKVDLDEHDVLEANQYEHETFKWLKPENIKDASGRRPTDADYDPTTLWLPPDFIRQQTPGHRQWWALKAANFDTILLFKVGKFYELYHMDAVVSVNCLSLAYMRGSYAHTGFPEAAYGKFADQLVSRGYKVARVEQTETPQQLEERNSQKSGAKDKVVKRELCRVTTCATRTYGVLDGTDNGLDSVESASSYLLAIKEQNVDMKSVYGVCFIDASVGQFCLGQWKDDDYRSHLRTLLASHAPAQILIERGSLSSETSAILNGMLSSVPKEVLAPKKQFYTPEDTVKLIATDTYLGSNISDWPSVLKNLLDTQSVLPQPNANYSLAWSALGAVVWYLKRCLIDVDMVTMKNFVNYHPSLSTEKNKECVTSSEAMWSDRRLVLDGVTLENLNLVPSGDQQSRSLSLYAILNKCVTPFGKRLLREWICAPTCDPKTLCERQAAISWLMSAESSSFVKKAADTIKGLPDLDRLLQKIHTLGLKYRAEEHPDSRAVMFENLKYNVRKIKELSTALQGFKACEKLFQIYEELMPESKECDLLNKLLGKGNESQQLRHHLEYFESLFDVKAAEQSGRIVPDEGKNENYDAAVRAVKAATKALDQYRREQERVLKCSISYFGTGKNRYQMEVPESKSLSNEYELKSKKKGYGRYYTAELEELISDMLDAESEMEKQAAEASRKVFADFDDRKDVWSVVAQRVATFDVLLSLSKYSQTCGLEVCQPQFIFDSPKPHLSISSGYHPCLATQISSNSDGNSTTYIANDSHLGGDNPSTVLLTGPNMGGKSTLMRQVAVLTVMAHIGCMVPARSMTLTPVDRIFTRIGANDRIMCGQSTFFVELNETQVMLRDATAHSLVLVDELGRGTSTFDGTAIASAVLSHVVREIGCRSYFSTHYHSLCETFMDNKNIAQAHMACMVENESEEDPTEEAVTFLYRLTSGVCPKSYGFYAAKLAGVRDEVVRAAYTASKRLVQTQEALDSDTLQKLKSAAASGVDVHELEAMIAAL